MPFSFVRFHFARFRLSILLTGFLLFATAFAARAHSPGQCAGAVRGGPAEPAILTAEGLVEELVRIEVRIHALRAYEEIPLLEALGDRVLAASPKQFERLRAEIAEFASRLETTPVNPRSAESKAARGIVHIMKEARKELDALRPSLVEKAQEIITDFEANGRAAIDHWRGSGGWQLEKLQPLDGVAGDAYSIRLNRGYRAVFTLAGDNEINFIYFSKTATHGSH